MEWESRTGQTARNSEATTWTERKRASVGGNGLMDQFMRETGMTIKSLVTVSTPGQIREYIMENISGVKWKALAITSTPMAPSIQASTSETRGKATESTASPGTALILDLGSKENSTDMES